MTTHNGKHLYICRTRGASKAHDHPDPDPNMYVKSKHQEVRKNKKKKLGRDRTSLGSSETSLDTQQGAEALQSTIYLCTWREYMTIACHIVWVVRRVESKGVK